MSETNVVNMPAQDFIKSSYLVYAEEVLLSRVLTKVQDGLKPSQRYTLYTMHEMGLKNSAAPKKCARVVGDVIGKYNPHGDQSAYEALVGLAEPWGERYPLVTFQGNVGSIDGDPPAAMRYTECKLSKIGESMLDGIEKNAVDMVPNFDDSEIEPLYLPGIFPSGLCNGTLGIGTGMASSMAPHFAEDIFKAIKHVLTCITKGEQPKLEDVINIVKAPDFPTGGVITNPEEAKKAYRTGKGTIRIRGKYEIKESKGHTTIVFTEIPYGINKQSLVENLGSKVYNEDADKVFKDNVADVVDRSEKGKIAICIELKKNGNPDIVLNNIFKQTKMENTFSINSVMLVDGCPEEKLSLLKIIELYIKSQLHSKVRVIRFDMEQYAKRLELVQGYINANSQIDEVIKTIRGSKDREATIANLMSKFGFTEAQAKGLYARQLGSLNSFDVNALIEEAEELKKKILAGKNLLSNKIALVQDYIQDIDNYIARGYFKGDKRRTEIMASCGQVDDRDLIEDENIVLFYTHNGMVKAIKSKDYGQQSRGGKGNGIKLREDDFVEEVLCMSNKDDIIIVTDKGKAYTVPAYHIPIVSKVAMGKYLNNYVTFEDGEKVVKVFSIAHGDATHQLLMVTKKGLAKRISLENMTIRKNGLRVITLNEDDELASVILTTGEGSVVLASHNGFAVRTGMENIPVASRTAKGNIAMRFKADDDYVIAAVSAADDDTLLVVSDKGLCKRCGVTDIPQKKSRGGKGVTIYKPTPKSGHAMAVVKADEDETLFVVTTNDMIIRTPVKDISTQSRNGHGVKAINLADGAEIASITLAPSEENSEEKQEKAA